MRILRWDTWVPPYRVRRSCRTGRRGRRPLQRLTVPVRRGTMSTHRPAGQMRILRRDTWVPPYRVRRSCRTGRRGRRPLQRLTAPVRRRRCPQHPIGQMRILRRDTWVPPYRVRRSCRTGRRGRRPLQRFIAPIRRGRCPHIAPPDKCVFCGGAHGSRPTGYAGHAGSGTSRTPSPTTVHRTHPQGGRCPQRPADSIKRQAQAPASLCVMRLFTWRSWRPHDRRGRPSDSAP